MELLVIAASKTVTPKHTASPVPTQTASPVPTVTASPAPVAPPFYQRDWFWEAFSALVALAALAYTVVVNVSSAKRRRATEKAAFDAQREAQEANALAEAEAAKKPAWNLFFNPDTPTANYFELQPTHQFGNGVAIEIPILVANVGEKSSGTFQIELYVPRELDLREQLDEHGSAIKTKSNTSPVPGIQTFAIRFRSWNTDLRPRQFAKLGSFKLFFDLGSRTDLDTKFYWRLTSQVNGYVFPPDYYGQIGVRFKLSGLK